MLIVVVPAEVAILLRVIANVFAPLLAPTTSVWATMVPLTVIAPVWLASPRVNVPIRFVEPITPDKVIVLPLDCRVSA